MCRGYILTACFGFLLSWHYGLSFATEPGFLDFDNLPETNFSCEGKVIGGYYADTETGCQMFHVCTIGQKGEVTDIKFLCLNGTVFDQETRVCERLDEVDCSKSESFYDLNLELYGNNGAGYGIQPENEESQDNTELCEEEDEEDCKTEKPTAPVKPSPTEQVSNVESEDEETTTQQPLTSSTTSRRPVVTSTSYPSTTAGPQILQFPSSSPETIAALLALHNAFTQSLQQHSNGKDKINPPKLTGFVESRNPIKATQEVETFEIKSRPTASPPRLPTPFSPKTQSHYNPPQSTLKTQYQSQPKPPFQSQPKPQFQSSPKPQFQSPPKTLYQSPPKPQFQSQPKPQYQSQPKPQYQSQPKPQYQSQPKPQYHSQPKPPSPISLPPVSFNKPIATTSETFGTVPFRHSFHINSQVGQFADPNYQDQYSDHDTQPSSQPQTDAPKQYDFGDYEDDYYDEKPHSSTITPYLLHQIKVNQVKNHNQAKVSSVSHGSFVREVSSPTPNKPFNVPSFRSVTTPGIAIITATSTTSSSSVKTSKPVQSAIPSHKDSPSAAGFDDSLQHSSNFTQQLPDPPQSYDDYREGDVRSDPFYNDVPKISRSKRSLLNDIVGENSVTNMNYSSLKKLKDKLINSVFKNSSEIILSAILKQYCNDNINYSDILVSYCLSENFSKKASETMLDDQWKIVVPKGTSDFLYLVKTISSSNEYQNSTSNILLLVNLPVELKLVRDSIVKNLESKQSDDLFRELNVNSINSSIHHRFKRVRRNKPKAFVKTATELKEIPAERKVKKKMVKRQVRETELDEDSHSREEVYRQQQENRRVRPTSRRASNFKHQTEAVFHRNPAQVLNASEVEQPRRATNAKKEETEVLFHQRQFVKSSEVDRPKTRIRFENQRRTERVQQLPTIDAAPDVFQVIEESRSRFENPSPPLQEFKEYARLTSEVSPQYDFPQRKNQRTVIRQRPPQVGQSFADIDEPNPQVRVRQRRPIVRKRPVSTPSTTSYPPVHTETEDAHIVSQVPAKNFLLNDKPSTRITTALSAEDKNLGERPTSKRRGQGVRYHFSENIPQEQVFPERELAEGEVEVSTTYPFNLKPGTQFSCDDKIKGGYYADVEAECYGYFICSQGEINGPLLKSHFWCGPTTKFNQRSRTCQAEANVACGVSERYFHLNTDILSLPTVTRTAEADPFYKDVPKVQRKKRDLENTTSVIKSLSTSTYHYKSLTKTKPQKKGKKTLKEEKLTRAKRQVHSTQSETIDLDSQVQHDNRRVRPARRRENYALFENQQQRTSIRPRPPQTVDTSSDSDQPNPPTRARQRRPTSRRQPASALTTAHPLMETENEQIHTVSQAPTKNFQPNDKPNTRITTVLSDEDKYLGERPTSKRRGQGVRYHFSENIPQEQVFLERGELAEGEVEVSTTYPFNLKPGTQFSCDDKIKGGYYADVEAECYGYFICSQGEINGPLLKSHFWCGPTTKFNQRSRTCQAEANVACGVSERYFHLNTDILSLPIVTRTAEADPFYKDVPKVQRRKRGLENTTSVIKSLSTSTYHYKPLTKSKLQKKVKETSKEKKDEEKLTREKRQVHSAQSETVDSDSQVQHDNRRVRPARRRENYALIENQQQRTSIRPRPPQTVDTSSDSDQPNSPTRARQRRPASRRQPASALTTAHPLMETENEQIHTVSQAPTKNFQLNDKPNTRITTALSAEDKNLGERPTSKRRGQGVRYHFSENIPQEQVFPQRGEHAEPLAEGEVEVSTTYPFNLKPGTQFSCDDKIKGGYYADVEAECYGYFICSQGEINGPLLKSHFWCGPTTKFNQRSRTCQVEANVACGVSHRYFYINKDILSLPGRSR